MGIEDRQIDQLEPLRSVRCTMHTGGEFLVGYVGGLVSPNPVVERDSSGENAVQIDAAQLRTPSGPEEKSARMVG